jgi:hypothetical protein
MKDQGQPKQGTGSANEPMGQLNPQQGEGVQPNKQGGHGGYSSDDEQKQVNRENEKMHNERDESDLDTSKEQRTDVDEDDRQSKPGKGPGL